MPRIIEDNEIVEEPTPTVKREPKRTTRRGDDRKLSENITQFYSMIGGAIASFGMIKEDVSLVASGNNLISKSADLSALWMELAEQNKMVHKFLSGFTEGSAVAGLVGGHVIALAPIAASRGIVPEGMAMMMMTEEAREATANYIAMQQAKAAANAAGNGTGH